MAAFTMCPDCKSEYETPTDRRFHAQPNACPVCGPTLGLWDVEGHELATGAAALMDGALALRSGRILAVKGLGGFHLLVDARDGRAVRRLRERKGRGDKPFAIMARDLAQVAAVCELDEPAVAALTSPEAPMLLLRRVRSAPVCDAVAPDNPYLGVMLPYTPLHHMLLRSAPFPVVATSGNLSDEPICTDEREAVRRLAGVADLYLVHDRPIARHVDDSVGWIVDGEMRLLRRARGFAPRPVALETEVPTVLAVGAHLKNAVALGADRCAVISQHIGDMETPEALAAFEEAIEDLLGLYRARPVALAHDLHPDYASTRWAERVTNGRPGAGARWERLTGLRRVGVQHHHAHLAACLSENGEPGPALGVVWDGTGYGTDGSVWGGEFLLGSARGYRRVGHLLTFRLPGGEAAIREPRRCALGLLFGTYGEAAMELGDLPTMRAFRTQEKKVLAPMLARSLNSPITSSMGRLFDGVASLLGLAQRSSFEGQAAMALEFAADPAERGAYPIAFEPAADASCIVLDWRPLVDAVIDDLRRGVSRSLAAARFHNALVAAMTRVAKSEGAPSVALTGGCFQNRRLTELGARELRRAGFRVLLHRQVPPGDGGIALGQIAVAAAALAQAGSGRS
jgi:hydrogenase maturation protein HypF